MEAKPARLPWARLRAVTYNTPGPGETVSRKVARAKRRTVEAGIVLMMMFDRDFLGRWRDRPAWNPLPGSKRRARCSARLCYVPVLTSDTSVRRTIRERRIRGPTGSGRSAARSTKFAATKRGDRPRRKAGEGERERSGQQPSVYLLVIDRRASRAPPIKETSQAGRLLPLLAPNVRYRKRTRSGRPHRLALHHVHDGDQDDGPDQGDDERDDKARRLGSEEQGEDESAQE